jgi:polyphosphate kinase
MTYDQEIGKAVSRLFRDICKNRIAGKERSYAPLAVSPVNMRSEIMNLIRRETRKGKSGRIFFKINSLTDEDMIEALMEASCAGCKVRMIVRGICCLLPGVEGCTENVCIVNKVGRFLEHSRVYIFGSGIDEVMYISSADLRKRNLDRRVEVACPVKSGRIRERIREIMYDVYCDMEKGRVMLPDGTYAVKPKL